MSQSGRSRVVPGGPGRAARSRPAGRATTRRSLDGRAGAVGRPQGGGGRSVGRSIADPSIRQHVRRSVANRRTGIPSR